MWNKYVVRDWPLRCALQSPESLLFRMPRPMPPAAADPRGGVEPATMTFRTLTALLWYWAARFRDERKAHLQALSDWTAGAPNWDWWTRRWDIETADAIANFKALPPETLVLSPTRPEPCLTAAPAAAARPTSGSSSGPVAPPPPVPPPSVSSVPASSLASSAPSSAIPPTTPSSPALRPKGWRPPRLAMLPFRPARLPVRPAGVQSASSGPGGAAPAAGNSTRAHHATPSPARSRPSPVRSPLRSPPAYATGRAAGSPMRVSRFTPPVSPTAAGVQPPGGRFALTGTAHSADGVTPPAAVVDASQAQNAWSEYVGRLTSPLRAPAAAPVLPPNLPVPGPEEPLPSSPPAAPRQVGTPGSPSSPLPTLHASGFDLARLGPSPSITRRSRAMTTSVLNLASAGGNAGGEALNEAPVFNMLASRDGVGLAAVVSNDTAAPTAGGSSEQPSIALMPHSLAAAGSAMGGPSPEAQPPPPPPLPTGIGPAFVSIPEAVPPSSASATAAGAPTFPEDLPPGMEGERMRRALLPRHPHGPRRFSIAAPDGLALPATPLPPTLGSTTMPPTPTPSPVVTIVPPVPAAATPTTSSPPPRPVAALASARSRSASVPMPYLGRPTTVPLAGHPQPAAAHISAGSGAGPAASVTGPTPSGNNGARVGSPALPPFFAAGLSPSTAPSVLDDGSITSGTAIPPFHVPTHGDALPAASVPPTPMGPRESAGLSMAAQTPTVNNGPGAGSGHTCDGAIPPTPLVGIVPVSDAADDATRTPVSLAVQTHPQRRPHHYGPLPAIPPSLRTEPPAARWEGEDRSASVVEEAAVPAPSTGGVSLQQYVPPDRQQGGVGAPASAITTPGESPVAGAAAATSAVPSVPLPFDQSASQHILPPFFESHELNPASGDLGTLPPRLPLPPPTATAPRRRSASRPPSSETMATSPDKLRSGSVTMSSSSPPSVFPPPPPQPPPPPLPGAPSPSTWVPPTSGVLLTGRTCSQSSLAQAPSGGMGSAIATDSESIGASSTASGTAAATAAANVSMATVRFMSRSAGAAMLASDLFPPGGGLTAPPPTAQPPPPPPPPPSAMVAATPSPTSRTQYDRVRPPPQPHEPTRLDDSHCLRVLQMALAVVRNNNLGSARLPPPVLQSISPR